MYEYGNDGWGYFDQKLSVVKELLYVGQDSQGVAQKLLSDENCLILLWKEKIVICGMLRDQIIWIYA